MFRNEEIMLAKKLSRSGRNIDGILWILLTHLGYQTKIKVKPDGRDILLRTASPDIQVALSCFGGEFKEVFEAVPILRNGLIIDAGGYIGTAAIVFAEAYPDATIVSLEPSRENYELLKENVKRYPNIIPMNKALAAQAGSLTLKNRGTGQWGFTIVSNPADRPESAALEEVDCTTIEEILKKFGAEGIGILKLDIEGAEHSLLSGDTSWIARTEAICIELHDRIVPGCTSVFTEKTAGRQNTSLKGEKFLSIMA